MLRRMGIEQREPLGARGWPVRAEIACEAELARRKQPRIHGAQGTRDRRPESHFGHDVALDVDPWSDLDQLETVRREPEHGALGDIEHVLTALAAIAPAVGDLLDGLDEL